MSELLKLAERCEKATGHDPALDREIWMKAVATKEQRFLVEVGRDQRGDKEANFRTDWMADGARYTASIDAAMTLVPEGWALTLLETTDGDRRDHTGDPLANWQAALIEHKNTGYRVDQRGCWRQGFAATAALALTAAALRAREEDRG